MDLKSKRQLRYWTWLVPLVLLTLPAEAHAHSPIKGMNDFINGVLHPVTTPAHILIILALGFWMGQRQPRLIRFPMIVFAPVSAVALVLTITRSLPPVSPWLLSGVALAAGILVAMDCAIPKAAIVILFAACAALIGLDSPVESDSGFTVFKTLLGVWISLQVLLCDIAIYVSLAKKPWQKIGIRVAGSWIIAISVLMLAFALKKRQ